MSVAFCVNAEIGVKNGDSIAFLGDSITEFGNGPAGYVNLVMKGLAVNGVTNVEKIAAGRGGHKSNNMLQRVDRDCLAKKPTFMTVSCGVNDVWHGKNGVPLEDYKKNMAAIFDKAAASNVTVIVLTSTMIGEDPDNGNNKLLEGYNEWLRAEAKARKLRLCDLNTAMREELKRIIDEAAKNHLSLPNNKLTKDGVHMNFNGDCMMAWAILKTMGVPEKKKDEVFAAWRSIPGIVNVSTWLSVAEYEELKKQAGDRDFQGYVRELVLGLPHVDPEKKPEVKAATTPECIQALVNDLVLVPGRKYKIGKYLVTQEQWLAVDSTNPSTYVGDKLPVHNISWKMCNEFIDKVNATPEAVKAGIKFRLPTQEEWETAAKAGKDGKVGLLGDGNDAEADELGWFSSNSGNRPHNVGEKKANGLGIHDMFGNVWEWTSTTFDNGNLYVLKGGSWQGGAFRWDFKITYHPPYVGQSLGLRLAADVK